MQVAALSVFNDLPIVCYLIQITDGVNVLVDTGLPPDDGAITPTDKDVVAQLALIGLRPDDIDMVVCSHFDHDHAGNHDRFPKAKYVIQRAHYENALSNPRYAPARPHWDQPIERFRIVEGDIGLLPGLELIETSGHAVGHQSVLVRLTHTGAVLLTIDAVHSAHSFTRERQPGGLYDDAEALIASTHKLLDLVEREQIPLVIFGHDIAQWRRLKKLPEYYE